MALEKIEITIVREGLSYRLRTHMQLGEKGAGHSTVVYSLHDALEAVKRGIVDTLATEV